MKKLLLSILRKVAIVVGLVVSMMMLAVIAVPAWAEPEAIYLLRHAEKDTSVKNGSLIAQGKRRAQHIAQMLKSAGVSKIYSTDYHRTQQTAAPLAKVLAQKVHSYDPRLLAQFAQQLKQFDGVIVVVGHSNTTPQLVNLLGGKANEMCESEYSRLYQLSFDQSGKVRTVLLHSSAR